MSSDGHNNGTSDNDNNNGNVDNLNDSGVALIDNQFISTGQRQGQGNGIGEF